MTDAKPIHEIAIMCPDENCCGCLRETVVGLPECNECGKVYMLVPVEGLGLDVVKSGIDLIKAIRKEWERDD